MVPTIHIHALADMLRTDVLQAKITFPIAMVGTAATHYETQTRRRNGPKETFSDQDATKRIDQRDVNAAQIAALAPSANQHRNAAVNVGVWLVQLEGVGRALHHADLELLRE